MHKNKYMKNTLTLAQLNNTTHTHAVQNIYKHQLPKTYSTEVYSSKLHHVTHSARQRHG